MIEKDYCDNCRKDKCLKYIILHPDGFVEFCTKKCAKNFIIKYWEDFVDKNEG